MPVAGSFQANDALVLRRAAVEGMGIAMLPRFAAAGKALSYALRQIWGRFLSQDSSLHAQNTQLPG